MYTSPASLVRLLPNIYTPLPLEGVTLLYTTLIALSLCSLLYHLPFLFASRLQQSPPPCWRTCRRAEPCLRHHMEFRPSLGSNPWLPSSAPWAPGSHLPSVRASSSAHPLPFARLCWWLPTASCLIVWASSTPSQCSRFCNRWRA